MPDAAPMSWSGVRDTRRVAARHRGRRMLAAPTVAVLAVAASLVSVVPLAGLSSSVTPGSWSYATPPPGRVYIAERLASGRVLASLISPTGQEHLQLYDPAHDQWTPVELPTGFSRANGFSRTVKTITALEDGTVLVGRNSQANPTYLPMYSLDLKDPDNPEWKEIATEYFRANHYTATLIVGTPEQCNPNCGKVLVAGGGNDSYDPRPSPYNHLLNRTAELYDPRSKTLTATAPVPGNLSSAMAVLLGDSRVLAAWNDAFLFDPTNGSWSLATRPPNSLQSYHAARLADGRVLAIPGPETNGNPRNHLLFDPAAGPPVGSWSVVDHCVSSPDRCADPTLLPDGTVLALHPPGNSNAQTISGAFVFDPASAGDATTPDWTPVPDAGFALETLTKLTGTSAQCGDKCGKVLGLGFSSVSRGPPRQDSKDGAAQLYKPGDSLDVTALSPVSGFACGGRDVTISGRGLNQVTEIKFGEASVSVESDNVNADGTAIIVKTPHHQPGQVDVSVTAAGRVLRPPGMTFTYKAVPPATVGSIGPRQGPVSGGTTVNIGGSFATECVRGVHFDAIRAASYNVGPADPGEAATSIAATSPAHDPARVRVRVEVDLGPEPSGPLSQLPTLPTLPPLPTDPPPSGLDVFTFHPVISGVFPPSGPLAGGNEVTIAGDGFSNASEVRFGTETASIARRSGKELVAVAPPSALAGPVVVRVVAAGIAALPDSVTYSYVAPLPVGPDPDPGDPGPGPSDKTGTPDPAPPGGSPAASPVNTPSPSPAPTPGVAPAPAPIPGTAPVPGQAPLPGQAPTPGQAVNQSASPTNSPAALLPPIPAASPVAAPGTAAGQGGPGANQGVAGAGEDDDGQGAHRYAMSDARTALALGAAGATGCFTFLAAARRQPARRRRRSGAGRPQPKGAY